MDARQLTEQLKQNPSTVQALMQSQDGQKLMKMLAGGDQTLVKQAAQSAAKGDTKQMMDMIRNMMSSPEGAALAERIRKSVQG